MIGPKRIYSRLWESRNERAEFLWKIYNEHSSEGRALFRGGLYLDVGSGSMANATVFRERTNVDAAVGIDIRDDIANTDGVSFVRGDAKALPFPNRTFELVTIFSIIQVVPEPFICLSEGLRVLKRDGELVLQFPNRYFPIDPHSGFPLYFYLPRRVQIWLADITRLGWMKKIDLPTLGKIRMMIQQLDPDRKIVTAGFYYPESLLPDSAAIRGLHRMLKHLRLFRLLPMGYMLVVRGHQSPAATEKDPK